MKVENPEEEITMKCVICNIGDFLLNKNTIYQVLGSLENIKEEIPKCGKCPEGLNNKVILYCKDCKIFLCHYCFTAHPSEHTLTKNLNVKTYNNLCTIHSEQTLMFECKTCSKPICLICEKIGHQGHQFSYIKDAYKEKKEKINKKLPFTTFEKFNTHLQEEKIKIQDDLKKKSKEFTDNIESLIFLLNELIYSYKNKIALFEENFKISTYNLKVLFKRFYEDLLNTPDDDYLNLYILSKLPDDYGKINLNQSININNISISSSVNIQLLKLKDELKNIKEISFTSNPVMNSRKISSKDNTCDKNDKNDKHGNSIFIHPALDLSRNPIINEMSIPFNPNYKKIESIQFNDIISTFLEIDNNLILGASFNYLYMFKLSINNNSLKLLKNIPLKKNLLNPPALLLLDNGNIVHGGDKLNIYDKYLNFVGEIHLNNNLNENHNLSLCRISEKSFAAGFNKGCIKILTRNSNQKYCEEHSLTNHINDVTSLLYLINPEYLLSGSLGEIKIWKLSQQSTPIKTLIGHRNYVKSIIYLNNEMFASCCRDIKIWSIKDDFKCLKTINAHWDIINSLKLIGNNYIITPSSEKNFKIWNARDPYECIGGYKENSEINNLLVTKNSIILTATNDKNINIWKSNI
jgi:hypothetical protein